MLMYKIDSFIISDSLFSTMLLKINLVQDLHLNMLC